MQGLVDTIIDHYRMQHRLARGGMGEIYLAEDIHTSQVVAIKMVSRDAAEDNSERFRREVQTIAALSHEHILPALDYGEHGPWSYLVMPYIAHGTLRDRLTKGPLDLKLTGVLLRQISEALEYAHAQGILHRDIKSSNVLLRDPQFAYLADFGLVKRVSDAYSLTRSGFLIGTPEYMAPELVEQPASVACDIYALGIMLYEMLTGEVPFKGSTPVAIVMRHMREMPITPSLVNPTLPPTVDRVILRAIHKDPRRRFSTPCELAMAYLSALEVEAETDTVNVAAVVNESTVHMPQSQTANDNTSPAPPILVQHVSPAPPIPVQRVSPIPVQRVSPDDSTARTFAQKPMMPHTLMPPPPPPFSPQNQRVKKPARSRWTLLIVSLLALLISGALLVAVFSAAQQKNNNGLPGGSTPVTSPVQEETPQEEATPEDKNKPEKDNKKEEDKKPGDDEDEGEDD